MCVRGVGGKWVSVEQSAESEQCIGEYGLWKGNDFGGLSHRLFAVSPIFLLMRFCGVCVCVQAFVRA